MSSVLTNQQHTLVVYTNIKPVQLCNSILLTIIHYLDFSESGLSTEELTQKVFESLANGKQHLTNKDIRNWDLVHVLLAEVSIICVLLIVGCYCLSFCCLCRYYLSTIDAKK